MVMRKPRVQLSWILIGIATLAIRSADAAAPSAQGELLFQDDFNGTMADGWAFEREVRTHWRASSRGLEVCVQPGNMWGGANNAKNVLLRAIPAPTNTPIEISVTISNQPTAQWEQANLVWFYDDSNMVKLGQELVTGRLSIVMGREEGDRARTVAIVPLDASTVELRLQAAGRLVRGQFRTAAWSDWRDIGICDLPVKGEPKASLHFYNGPPNEEHWVRVNHFTVRRLPPAAANWPRVRAIEKTCRASDSPRLKLDTINLPGGFILRNDLASLAAEPKAEYQQTIFLNRDSSYGWFWDRRVSANNQPTLAGVNFGTDPSELSSPNTEFEPINVASLKSLELDLDVVTRLENDQGGHNLVAVLKMRPAGRLSIWFDWYGPTSNLQSLNDGYRDYGRMPSAPESNDTQYRIKGFRGSPPRVNLKAFLDDAVRHGLSPSIQVIGVCLGNEIWNGSRGGTIVTRLDLIVDGRRYSSIARNPR